MFKVGKDGYAALISPEGNLLKVSVFSLSNINQDISSEILPLNGARVILGPDIQPYDENNDGNISVIGLNLENSTNSSSRFSNDLWEKL